MYCGCTATLITTLSLLIFAKYVVGIGIFTIADFDLLFYFILFYSIYFLGNFGGRSKIYSFNGDERLLNDDLVQYWQ